MRSGTKIICRLSIERETNITRHTTVYNCILNGFREFDSLHLNLIEKITMFLFVGCVYISIRRGQSEVLFVLRAIEVRRSYPTVFVHITHIAHLDGYVCVTAQNNGIFFYITIKSGSDHQCRSSTKKKNVQ